MREARIAAEEIASSIAPVDWTFAPEWLLNKVAAIIEKHCGAGASSHTAPPAQTDAECDLIVCGRIVELIDAVTGPTGGWLVSPKELTRRIQKLSRRQRGAGGQAVEVRDSVPIIASEGRRVE